jgi:AraC-like DNA-binding protein
VLAEEVNLSPKYLSDLFRRETGQTVLSYIQEQKIREAKFLLRHTEDSLGEISHRLNFSSQSYFTAVFRKTTNLTPRQYRALHISDERL